MSSKEKTAAGIADTLTPQSIAVGVSLDAKRKYRRSSAARSIPASPATARALLQEVRELRPGIAEVGQGIDRLMVMRRRELAGLPPVRSVHRPAAASEISGPQQTAGFDPSPEPEAGV